LYPDAHAFKPDRFLKDGQIDPDVKDPEELIFGCGRRYFPFPTLLDPPGDDA
jgi:cytochrome P450